jgi:DNA-binding response OmpR family regulator
MPPAVPTKSDEPSELDIKSILLLDDDHLLADTLKLLLEAHNFVVTVVHNGADGIREIMKLDFDVILCDLMMPRMAGDVFYLAVQRVKPRLTSRFIFITGHGNHARVATFLQQVGALVLKKPASTNDLIRTISLVVKRNRATSGAVRCSAGGLVTGAS